MGVENKDSPSLVLLLEKRLVTSWEGLGQAPNTSWQGFDRCEFSWGGTLPGVGL